MTHLLTDAVPQQREVTAAVRRTAEGMLSEPPAGAATGAAADAAPAGASADAAPAGAAADVKKKKKARLQ